MRRPSRLDLKCAEKKAGPLWPCPMYWRCEYYCAVAGDSCSCPVPVETEGVASDAAEIIL
jgi:hypothetical protein